MACEDCKNKINDIKLGGLPMYQKDELKTIHEMRGRSNYTPDETAYHFNLYNRVFNRNEQPGCGKCFYRVKKLLLERYDHEFGG